jgi:hypothetical protein
VALERPESEWLTEQCEFSLEELVELSGLPEPELRELVEYGAIAPVDPGAARWVFKGQCLTTVRVACRLRASFELEPHGLALVVSLLERVRDLEAQIERLRAQLPRRVRS